MKHVRLFSLFVVLLLSNLALAGNYILVIDGKEYEVDLDEKASIQLPDGKALNVTLKKKAVVTYKTDLYSFDHPSEVTPTRQDLGEGIHQMMLTTAQGSAVIVQDYTTMDPTPLIDMMLTELTKEEKQYGYKFLDTPYKKKLVDGSEVAGKQSISSLEGQQVTRRVVTVAGKGKGLLIITMLDKEAPAGDKKMIDTFWDSLKPNLK
ncbi:MAG: hypothetical protein ACF8OB_09430 [Phycisphaeraceae bacterium JB051]